MEYPTVSYVNGAAIVQVVGDKVVAGMYRFSEQGDFRANLSNGGSARAYQAKEKEEELAVKICKLLGLSFAGVDLLFGEDGNFLVCVFIPK